MVTPDVQVKCHSRCYPCRYFYVKVFHNSTTTADVNSKCKECKVGSKQKPDDLVENKVVNGVSDEPIALVRHIVDKQKLNENHKSLHINQTKAFDTLAFTPTCNDNSWETDVSRFMTLVILVTSM